MQDAILVLNAGSSSLKYSLFTTDALSTPALHGTLELPVDMPDADHAGRLQALLVQLHDVLAPYRLTAIGHRIVHGGMAYTQPVLIDTKVISALHELTPLAPLHQGHNLAGVTAARVHWPAVPQFACFDTAFHHTLPDVAKRFGLPRALHDAGIRRYGFHGLSFESIVAQLPSALGEEQKANGRIIIAHLGNGASLCALKNKQSIATSMGLTPLDGLLMGTRCGSIDPGVLLYLQQNRQYSLEQLSHLLYAESGLLGVSGISHDMRTLLTSESETARQAVDLFCYRIIEQIGAYVALLGGLDTFVFTGGIGEHAPTIRNRIINAFNWLPDFKHLVIPCNEEAVIATHCASLLTA